MNELATCPSVPQPWFTPIEAAVLYGVSKSTLYELLRQGKSPHRLIGKQIRIPRSAVMPQETSAA